MFDRDASPHEGFSEEGQEFLALAAQEARRWNHAYVGTEHLLLAMARKPESRAAEVLARLNIDPKRIEDVLGTIIAADTDRVIGETPLTPRSQRIIALALAAAARRQARAGSDDVLVGLLEEGEGIGAQVLASFGVVFDPNRREPMLVQPLKDAFRRSVGSDR